MKRVFLFDDDCMDITSPQWWRNFVEYTNARIENVDKLLEQHNAKFTMVGTYRYVDFENDGDHVLFVLKYS